MPKQTKQVILGVGLGVALCMLALLWWLFGAVRYVCRVELGAAVPPASALVRWPGGAAEYLDDSADSIDTMVPGDYPVQLRALGLQRDVILRVQDSTPPTGLARSRVSILGHCALQAEDFVASVHDSTAVTAALERPWNPQKRGTQNIRVALRDEAGNKSRLKAQLRLLSLRDLELEARDLPDPLTPYDLFDERRIEDIPIAFGTQPDDWHSPGEHAFTLQLDGQDIPLTLRVVDKDPPKVKTQNVDSYVGVALAPAAFLKEVTDDSKTSARFVTPPDFTATGRQIVEIAVEDAAGNRTVVRARLKIEADDEPPVLSGVKDIVVGRYGTVAYRKGITATDNSGKAALRIDSSAVDTNEPGEYEVIYTATDGSGNVTTARAKVTVTGVSQEAVDRLADPILAQLVKEGMTSEEKAKAIHTWIKANVGYHNTGEKNSVLEGAYNALALRRGDCYTFYAIAKYLLGRAGIDSIDMHRVDGTPTRHYWLAVDLGQGYHHYDACPVKKPNPHGGFMMSDSEALGFTRVIGRIYYEYDPAILPEGVAIVP